MKLSHVTFILLALSTINLTSYASESKMNRLDRIIASDSNQEEMSLQEFKVLQLTF